MPPKEKYTDPELRDEVKEEIHKSDKGGAPGQWSARKAQMMASEYKKRGGDYNTDKSEKDESQKHLDNWGKEDWQTKEGSGDAKQEDGTQKRYLPKKAWENMNEEEKKETDDKKQAGSKKGKQHVENTTKAKDSRKKASKSDGKDQKQEGEKEDDVEQDDAGSQPEDDDEEDDDGENDDKENDEEKADAKAGQKRGRGKQDDNSSKKQKSNSGDAKSKDEKPKKTIGSKHMDAEEPGKKGSADRLPEKNQSVQWKAMPGYVAGKLVEVIKKDKTIDGKSHKASEKDPKLVLKSDSSGKICVHKPESCFYD